MGCDIHPYIERKNKETGKWESLSLYYKKEDGTYEECYVYGGRCYQLFGLLAGVRSWPSDPFVSTRGVPNDLSEEVQKHWDSGKREEGEGFFGGTDWHSATWYDYCELEAYSEMLNKHDKLDKINNKRIVELEKEIARLKSRLNGEDLGDDELFYDWDNDDEATDAEVMNGFMSDINNVLNAYNIYWPKPGDIRVVMWFDS